MQRLANYGVLQWNLTTTRPRTSQLHQKSLVKRHDREDRVSQQCFALQRNASSFAGIGFVLGKGLAGCLLHLLSSEASPPWPILEKDSISWHDVWLGAYFNCILMMICWQIGRCCSIWVLSKWNIPEEDIDICKGNSVCGKVGEMISW